jgi:hypothetical protein
MTMPALIQDSGFPFIDLLKVDIEGAEVELFRGDLGWLNTIGAIAIEFHQDSRERSGFDRIVRDRGFVLHEANQHTVLACRV